MKLTLKYICLITIYLITINGVSASTVNPGAKEDLNVREFILHHLSDSYEWKVTEINNTPIIIPLPVILFSQYSGWHFFWSSEFHKTPVYENFTIATEGKYTGKIIELHTGDKMFRPFDLSITKVVFSLLFNSTLLLIIFMYVVKSYKKNGIKPQKGLSGMMEMFVMSIHDEVIKPCIGKHYRFYAPYLLTMFFFILLNNLFGLIPIFPGGVGVTANIAITMVLALIVFFMVNAYGTKEYWKEIIWPDVPLLLKFPIPLMPIIEILGVFTKPFALMIRLFATMLAGHAIVLGLATLIFVTVKMGPVINTSMTIVSVILSIFINFLEILVAFIQAYVFVLLSSVFIGLSKIEPHYK